MTLETNLIPCHTFSAMMDSIQITLVMVGILAVISIVNPLLLVPLAITIVCFCLVLKLYLRPAQDLKRLEGICKSRVNSFKKKPY